MDDDRLSSLHDSILLHILSFLPTKDSIRTSILAKQYRRIWLSVPALKFTVKTPHDVEIVDQVLSVHASASIRKLSVKSRHSNALQDQNLSQAYAWADYAAEHNVQNLHISLELLPQILETLYHCKSLRQLRLVLRLEQPLQMPAPATPLFTNLKDLTLQLVHQISGDSIGELISHCRSLRVLCLTSAGTFNALKISAPKLKKLELDLFKCAKLRVYCSRLRYFTLQVEKPVKNFCGRMPCLCKAEVRVPFVTSKSDVFWGQILPSVSNATCLCLSSCLDYEYRQSHILEESDKHLPTFQNLKTLQLDACFHFDNIEFLVYLLQRTPNLNSLAILCEAACNCVGKSKIWRPRKLSSKILQELKSVVIFKDKMHIRNKDEFVGFLSLNASSWEKVSKMV